MLLETIRNVIKDQEFHLPEQLIERKQSLPEADEVLVVTGIRRCGKSTMLRMQMQKNASLGFVNFEDPRLTLFDKEDFFKLENIFNEMGITAFCFDEIQNISGWEKYVRSAYDRGIRVYLTGSNSSLLSRELGTKLTGRHLQFELFPFDFLEFVEFRKLTANHESLLKYLVVGGFPEYLKNNSKEYLQTLFRDIILRDIVVRRNIRNEKQILDLGIYLISNTAKLLSYNQLTKLLGIKSVRTTIDYCDFLQDAYLFQFIPRFSFSIKKQINNQKKVYAVDNGMINTNTLSFSRDNGRLLENLVFQQLRRQHKEIYYHMAEFECDFLIKEGRHIIQVIQVCWEVAESNLSREIGGIKEALDNHKEAIGFIITYSQKDKVDDIHLIPVSEWLQSRNTL
jgi:predicted AAA+ superfamily ATPase